MSTKFDYILDILDIAMFVPSTHRLRKCFGHVFSCQLCTLYSLSLGTFYFGGMHLVFGSAL